MVKVARLVHHRGHMEFDVFFSISRTPVDGWTPTEAEMIAHFDEQVALADQLGFGVAWIAQAHLSTEVQKQNSKPVIPHWQGEVGLCTDFFQLAHRVLVRTRSIDVGSAVLSILAHGGPITNAERVANLVSLHGLDEEETRRIHLGFAAGRFEFMARPYGIVPRDAIEEEAWPALRGRIFAEATEIFLRLLRGDVVASDGIMETVLDRSNFRADEDWAAVQTVAVEVRGLAEAPSALPIARRYEFEALRLVPQEWRHQLLDLVIGSHDPWQQAEANRWAPVKVFNLSITSPELIEATHQRMKTTFHPDGGVWQRSFMPRTVMVFINEEPDLSPSERSAAARVEADAALGTYWTALEGTIDPLKVNAAANNAVIGTAAEIVAQLRERFVNGDRLMCWFDFFIHDSARVCRNMEAFMRLVATELGH